MKFFITLFISLCFSQILSARGRIFQGKIGKPKPPLAKRFMSDLMKVEKEAVRGSVKAQFALANMHHKGEKGFLKISKKLTTGIVWLQNVGTHLLEERRVLCF